MSELPKGWEETSFGEVIRSVPINDKKLPRKQYSESGKFPVVDQGQEFIGGYCDEKERVVEEDLPLIIFGDHTRIFKFLNQPFVPGADGIKVLKPLGVDEKWLYHIAHALEFPDKGYARHFQHLKKAHLLVPPLLEQRRIVARIEELFSRLDAGVAALRHGKAQLQRYRQSVLAAAVTGQLTQAWREQHPDTEPAEELLSAVLAVREETWAGRGKYNPPVEAEDALEQLPSKWTWTTLAHLANHIADGTHKTPTYLEDGVPFLSAKDVNGFKLSFDKCRYIPREEHEELIKRCYPKPGNVLVTKSGTIGRIAVVRTDRDFSLFESVANVPVIPPVCSDFIAYASHVGISGSFGAKNKKGVAVRHLHLEDLRRLPIPLPPLEEQHQIVAETEARITEIDHLEAELDAQTKRSQNLRSSILETAFSGNLVPQNPTDESAKILLKRIRTKEKEMPKKKTPRRKVAKKRATVVSTKEELVALLQQLGGSDTPERLLVESKLENHIDAFFELIREASGDKLIDAPIGEFGEISLPKN